MKRILVGIDLPDVLAPRAGHLVERIGRIMAADANLTEGVVTIPVGIDSPIVGLVAPEAREHRKIGTWRVDEVDIERFRHLGRDTTYDTAGTLQVQTDTPIVDGAVLTIYVANEDGKVYGRPPTEFYHPDRFVPEDIEEPRVHPFASTNGRAPSDPLPEPAAPSKAKPGPKGKFEIYEDKAGEFRVRFKVGREIVFATEGYSTRANAKRSRDRLKSLMKDA
ncbi:hypothetical protein BAJUN_00730 [Bajunvirus bajun]|uniref:Uncharacterized protein n=1 Tax=Brevundimonas phage vB_BgoS-Bajun TaxID=2948594 RepID=A0A9E7SRJ8_9CAUD|nr:hypothetical protein BAJUN_00730 [Brevundimonas phage vB_BgoS-Bajun]